MNNMMRLKFFSLLLLIPFFFSQCTLFSGDRLPVTRDTTITPASSFNNLFFDSSQISDFLAKETRYAAFAEQFMDFYKERNFQYAWIDSSGLSEQALNFINLENNYIQDMDDSSLHNPRLNRLKDSILKKKKIGVNQLKERMTATELLITGQFFLYSAKTFQGSDLNAAELGWFIPRKKINLTEMLGNAVATGELYPRQNRLQNRQYALLQQELIKYIALARQPEPDTMANTATTLHLGDSGQLILAIKERLKYLGDTSLGQKPDNHFDSSLLLAVRKFQQRTGLTPDGSIGNKMIRELNVPIKKRIRQILINLERVRWLPAENDSNYILVNIPEFKMHVYDSLNWKYDMRVIVGTAANSSAIFSGQLRYIVFSPYWNVPESIVLKEIMPAMARNPNYLTKNHMEITGYKGKIPIIRQLPGPWNSLGLVKFLFPNNYSIYLHDTPNRNLFQQSNRSLSHGCIRIGEPKKFAAYLLRKDPSWTEKRIDSAMHQKKEQWVTLPKGLPVLLVYFTAWVDREGQLNFRKDIYGHDARMEAKLFER
ncbi:MAG: L,D-transpeptidase family protein [Sediminibacterium sp.]